MLSIVIPTYNYFTFPLVKELHEQATSEKINFEIIVIDDASKNEKLFYQNQEINSLSNCVFRKNTENLGRGKTINKLVSMAKFDNLLILDCDTMPQDQSFIHNYISSKQNSMAKIFFGGIIYNDTKPLPNEMLRWVYGKKRESLSVEARKKNPYNSALTSNILIEKKVLEQFPFHDEITEYGFEDLVLMLELKKNSIPIAHIDNPLYHLKLDKSIDFINKFHSSLNNLKKLYEMKIINYNDTSLTKVFNSIEKLKITKLVAVIFDVSKNQLIKNLTSNSPSIFVFDLYRLGYFCKINIK